jgi:tetratricopeptide (TPR) repeat protein
MSEQQTRELALLYHQSGRLLEAERLYRQILAVEPDANVHNNLGQLLNLLGRNAEAIIELGRAIALRPDLAEPRNNLGIALAAVGRGNEAIAPYRAAIALQPNHARAHSNLGNALKTAGKTQEAITCYQTALSLDPNYGEAYSNLGALLNELGKTDEALRCHRRAIELRPDYAQGHFNLGSALSSAGRHEEAIDAHRRAISLQPHLPQAHFNLALELLRQGKFAEGWAEFEWRCRMPNLVKITKDCPQPLWDGSDLGNRVLLLYAEQGIGDTIQFVRYVPLIRGQVLLEIQPSLSRLLNAATSHGGEFDVHLPLLSLPLILRQFDPTATQVPYIRPISRQDLDPRRGFRVGLAWAGSATHKNDRNRSIPLAKLAPLAQDGVEFFSVQVGPGANQTGMQMMDLTDRLHDFADTAALIAELDLIISVDTAVAHLAGAMGKPVWVLLPEPADWRWLLKREDSPWYPTMRLFRQSRPGEWDEPIERMAQELAKFKSQ